MKKKTNKKKLNKHRFKTGQDFIIAKKVAIKITKK